MLAIAKSKYKADEKTASSPTVTSTSNQERKSQKIHLKNFLHAL